ncbi:hypothetical protein [Carnobacterium pleistocenium]|uniref:hypothetical protein n=1 Tax=Carnobacterium pleistocenium TaxID=181073 RepID=UPI000556EA9D|nr:hypothetical protein [Carnobacterium pleistocenium]
MFFSTGDIKEKYEIIDVIMTHSQSESGFFKQANYNESFKNVNVSLTQLVTGLGADGVINLNYEPQMLLDSKRTYAGIFVTGTAVRLVN